MNDIEKTFIESYISALIIAEYEKYLELEKENDLIQARQYEHR